MRKEMCYCCEREAIKKIVIEPSGDMFVYCCESDACSKHIHKLLSEHKYVNDFDVAHYMSSHQIKERKKYSISSKNNLLTIAIIGTILTGYVLYRILQMSGIC